jgi:hypothetical protein
MALLEVLHLLQDTQLFRFFKNRLSENFAIFLDDTNRIGEKEILAAWSSQFSFYQLVKEDYTYLSNKKGFDIYI